MRLKHALWLMVVALLLTAAPAWAAEEGGGWRPIWDLAWRYINFLIIAGVLVKLAKQPLANLFATKRAEHAETIEAMEDAKKKAQDHLAEIQARVANLQEELAAFDERVSEMAAKDRDAIMAQARQDVDLILERATIQADRLLATGRQKLVKEMVDLAGEIAEEKIRAAIDASDQARMVDDFTTSVARQQAQA
jgi:F-type H+-transporting ATPase subunit b